MAILLSNTVWEGTSIEPRPTYAQGARDGQFYKELDTGESYIRVDGVFVFINLGLSFIKATKSGKIITDTNGQAHIVFVTPFINDQYTVALTCEDKDWGNDNGAIAYKYGLTKEGFYIQTRNVKQGKALADVAVSWVATRDYNP